MMERKGKGEVWRQAAAEMKKLIGPAKAKALQRKIAEAGVPMSVVIGRIVDEFLGENQTEDQVRALAATLSKVVGVSVDRFLTLWREERIRR